VAGRAGSGRHDTTTRTGATERGILDARFAPTKLIPRPPAAGDHSEEAMAKVEITYCVS